MRDRVYLEHNTGTRSGASNSKTPNWVAFGTLNARGVWGEVKDVDTDKNSEDAASSMRRNTRRRVVKIRWQEGVTTAMRLRVNSETAYYQIVNMADIGYRDALQLTVEEYRS
jgi:head-tail adaptor